MNSKELFSLAVRLLGLGFVYHGLSALPAASTVVFAGLVGGSLSGFLYAIFTALWPLLVAYWLLRGAPLLMQIAYPGASAAPTATGIECATNAGRPGGVGT